MMQASNSPLAKALRWLFAAAAVVLVVQYPAEAATWVRAASAQLGGAVEGLVAFFRAVSE